MTANGQPDIINAIAMTDILVRNLSKQAARRLKERAARNKRSMQAEALAIIEAGIAPAGADLAAWLCSRPREPLDLDAAATAIAEARRLR